MRWRRDRGASRYIQRLMLGKETKKYSVKTTTINTENPMLKIALPTPRIPPSRLVMFEVSETKRFTSVVITEATSNSSSMVRKASEAMKSETTVGKIWTNSVVCSTITGTRAEINTVIMPISNATAVSTPTPRGAPQECIFDTNGSKPKVMNIAVRIQMSSCTLEETTKYSASAKPTPMVNINPVLIGRAIGCCWADSGVSVTEPLTAVIGVVGYSSGSGTVN